MTSPFAGAIVAFAALLAVAMIAGAALSQHLPIVPYSDGALGPNNGGPMVPNYAAPMVPPGAAAAAPPPTGCAGAADMADGCAPAIFH